MPALRLDILEEHYDALLVANGTPLPRSLLTRLLKRAEHLVALDGGVNTLYRYKIAPEIVAGDLDSATREASEWARQNGAKIRLLPSQELPDLAKGCELCRSLGMKRILVAGFSGHRTDHVLAALTFALRARGMEITLVSQEIVAFALRGNVVREFEIPAGHTISWFALPKAGPCSLTGVRWPFRNRTLAADGFHSLSNLPDAPRVRLSQQAGHSIFMVSLAPQVRAMRA